MSVPQIVVVVSRTNASAGPMSGIGFSSSTIRFFSTKIAAFMVAMAAVPLWDGGIHFCLACAENH
ncbi:hypothetical protein D9M71_483110 [compost metagenome]